MPLVDTPGAQGVRDFRISLRLSAVPVCCQQLVPLQELLSDNQLDNNSHRIASWNSMSSDSLSGGTMPVVDISIDPSTFALL
jgi:hypothetical protein